MKLFNFNFLISHRVDKINLVDALLRYSNYKDKNRTINKMLLIL